MVTDIEALKVYFDPLRARIVNELRGEPRSVHELAAALDIPFTRLYYHIHLLEKHGFIRLVETRTLAGAVEEKYYQIAAYMFTIDRKLLMVGTPEGDEGFELTLSMVLDATARDIRQSVEQGYIDMSMTAPDPKSLLLKRGMYSLTPKQARRFHERVRELLVEICLDPDDDEKQDYAVVVAFYPTAMDSSTEEG
jgi:DNA-binding transcriptional ArsR family regulator